MLIVLVPIISLIRPKLSIVEVGLFPQNKFLDQRVLIIDFCFWTKLTNRLWFDLNRSGEADGDDHNGIPIIRWLLWRMIDTQITILQSQRKGNPSKIHPSNQMSPAGKQVQTNLLEPVLSERNPEKQSSLGPVPALLLQRTGSGSICRAWTTATALAWRKAEAPTSLLLLWIWKIPGGISTMPVGKSLKVVDWTRFRTSRWNLWRMADAWKEEEETRYR